MNPFPIILQRQNLLLLPDKAIFWKEMEMLILSDIHLGKVGHFRKAGIPIPKSLEQEDLSTLSDLIQEYTPKILLILGDFFHSKLNSDWDWVRLWRGQFPTLVIKLVKGNHDILKEDNFKALEIELFPKNWFCGPFKFSHIPSEEPFDDAFYEISGHIHPSISIKGKAGQCKNVPCYYLADRQAILPAFGKFTGMHKIRTLSKAQIFIINGRSVIPLKNSIQKI